MKKQFAAALLPGVALFATALVVGLRPAPVVRTELAFAADAVRWLQSGRLEVRAVYRWSHSPFPDASRAAAIETKRGTVHLLLREPRSEHPPIRIIEIATDRDRHRYTLVGASAEPLTWESNFPWLLARREHWLFVTHDRELHRMLTALGAVELPTGN